MCGFYWESVTEVLNRCLIYILFFIFERFISLNVQSVIPERSHVYHVLVMLLILKCDTSLNWSIYA